MFELLPLLNKLLDAPSGGKKYNKFITTQHIKYLDSSEVSEKLHNFTELISFIFWKERYHEDGFLIHFL